MAVPPESWGERDRGHGDEPVIRERLTTFNLLRTPPDVSDAEWQFVVPYLCLLPEDAGQRVYELRDVFDGLRWIVRTGSP
jgi:hypothetical protein